MSFPNISWLVASGQGEEDVTWLQPLTQLHDRGEPCIIVTLAAVRGHAPRGAGSKMLVSAKEVYGSVGGGNLEQTAIEKSRMYLSKKTMTPELLSITLNPKGGDYGVQCCGGEVTLLLEPVYPQRPTVAIFGAGHVGWALVQVLGTLPIKLVVVDSRPAQLETDLPSPLSAEVHLTHAAVPETVLEGLPSGSHLLILTHDHAEDLAILETALRQDKERTFGFIGLIGSSVKWQHFQRELLTHGLSKTNLERVTTPIGLPGVPGKRPQAIAIGVAAQLLSYLELPESEF